ncbi:DUF2612 domain-containing protein [Mannheimia bovis]|uniref:DUF2612 domain-containing protein n=1 Tax=Mannheimia bovis TaxID=2770636 RepID=A0A7H1C0S4_9PAST|nr:DUF2612 domain-containing protein [Mannheimia bovis]QNS14579.1 DUF2612 domain-containing protein [Mannheimia bovis]
MENYTEIAISNNLIQFNRKPKIEMLYRVLFEPFNAIQTSLAQLITLRHLDTAKGKQLDGIGSILGIERPYTTSDGVFYFGFTGQSRALGFSQAVIRSNSLSIGSGNFKYMSDHGYRRLLHWKIIANNSHGTVEDIIRACKAVFLASKVEVIEGNCEIIINVTRKRKDILDSLDSVKEKLIPASAGVFVTVNFIDLD